MPPKKKETTKAIKKEGNASLASIIHEINKLHGENTIGFIDQMPTLAIERISTGSLWLDYALGGGWPLNRVIELFGPFSSGKSLISLKTIVEAQKRGMQCAFIDVENCIAEDQEIFDPISGFVGNIGEFMKNKADDVHVMSVINGETHIEQPVGMHDAGIQNTLELKTKSTRLKATHAHPVLTFRNGKPTWVKMENLKIGDNIARIWKTDRVKINSSKKISVENAELVGLLLGDGAIGLSNSSYVFTNVDDNIWKKLDYLLKKWNYKIVRFRNIHGRLVENRNYGKKFKKGELSPLKKFFYEIGLNGLKSGDKFIPNEILSADTKVISAVLRGLWMTDGTVNSVRCSASFSTTSRKLVVHVRYLLSRLGILGRIFEYENENSISYNINVNGFENIKKLNKALNLYSYKGKMLKQWSLGRVRNWKKPSEFYQPNYNPNLRRCSKRGEFMNNSDIWWDEIISINESGKIHCYDATVQKTHSWVVNDIVVHNTFDPRFAEKIGINLNKLLVSQSSVGEPTIDMICNLLESGEVQIIVVDSVAALIPSPELADPMQQQTIGLHARMMSKALRKITALNKGTLVIFINQQREMVGSFSSYGTPLATTGGRALGFYASVRVEVKRGEDIEESKHKIGQVIKFKVQKNKTSVPFRTGFIKYFYSKYSFDGLDEAISLGLILGVISQRGPAYDFEGQSFFGRAKLEEALTADKTLFDKLKKSILENDAFTGIETKKPVKKETDNEQLRVPPEVEKEVLLEEKGKE